MFINNHIKLESIDSTNNYILRLEKMGFLKEGLVVTANYQSSGKGQRGNFWESNADQNLLVSVVIEPRICVNKQFDINKIVSLSLCDFLNDLGLSPSIKWPNDILISNKKIAGVLIQNKLKGNLISHSIIGIGLNINQIYFKHYLPNATSLKLVLQNTFNIDQVRIKLLFFLSQRIKKYRKGRIQSQEYLKMLYLKDKVSYFDIKGIKTKGVIKSVSKSGRLVVQIEDDKIVEFENKTIRHLF